MTRQTARLASLCALVLSACNRAPASPTPTLTPTVAPPPAASPTPKVNVPTLPPAWTSTRSPTPTSVSTTAVSEATPTETPSPSASEAAASTQTPTQTLPPPADSTLTDKVEFVADVTVPDGMQVTPETKFTKTWRVKNAGTSTWNADYALVFVRGEKLGGPDRQPLPGPVPPGQSVDLSVDLTAPASFGALTGFWMLRNALGELFGLGPQSNEPLYVQVNVVPAAGGNPAPTVAAGPIKVTAVAIEVDNASVTGPCPHTFHFIGSFTSEGAGAVTYRIEAESDLPGFQFDLPPASESAFSGTGPRGFAASYDLDFRNSVTAWVWLHILSPADAVSNTLTVTLACAP